MNEQKLYNSYYECKRCFHKFYQKNDINRHLKKKNLCIRTIESYSIQEDKLEELSLIRQKMTNNNKCKYCNKIFLNTSNLNRHMKIYCKSKNDTEKNIEENIEKNIEKNIEENIKNNEHNFNDSEKIIENNIEQILINSNSNNNNNNVNNISININLIKSFDDDWDLSKIDINKKLILLLNNSKFTKTLENILENEVNLNVLIDTTSNNGLVYKDNKLINMDIKDIVKKTMEKLHKHLCDFHEDIINPNELNINTVLLDCELDVVNEKYNKFKNDNKIENSVNQYITDIYNIFEDVYFYL